MIFLQMSAPTYLLVILVSPFAVAGIWLIASESLIGSEFRKKLSAREFEERFFWIIILLLTLVVIAFQFWGTMKTPILALCLIAIAFTYLQQRKRHNLSVREISIIEGELRILIQYLTLLVSSGISPMRALQLFSQRTNCLIASRIAILVEAVVAGSPTAKAIDDFVNAIDSASVRRFGNTLVVAMERGSPLVPILSALVKDCPVDAKNAILRKAGKSEIFLMVPVVFLLLPISVLFALYPSLSQLR